VFDEAASVGRVREYVNGQFANLTAPNGADQDLWPYTPSTISSPGS
jgi:hypothetical protein